MFNFLDMIKPTVIDLDTLFVSCADGEELNVLTLINDEDTRSSWAFLVPLGPTVVWNKKQGQWAKLDVTDQLAGIMAQETQRYIEDLEKLAPAGGTVAYPPIQKEHKEEGQRYGHKLRVELLGEDDWRGVWAQILWSKETWPKVLAGEYEFVSAGILARHTAENGEEYGPIIKETSLVSDPRFKRIGTLQDTLHLQFSDTQGSDMTEEQLEALIMKCINKALDDRGLGTAGDDGAGDTGDGGEVDTGDGAPEGEEEIPSSDNNDTGGEWTLERIGSMLTNQQQQINALKQQKGKVDLLNFSEQGSEGTPSPKPTKQTHSETLRKVKEEGKSGAAAIAEARRRQAKRKQNR